MHKEIAIKAADLAIESIGITETDKDNHGPMIKKYLSSVGLPEGYAWCQAMIKYLFIKSAGFLNLKLSDSFLKLDGYCPTWQSYAKKHNLWLSIEDAEDDYTLVKKGYLAYFYSTEKERVYHVEIVLYANEDHVITVGGNTSSSSGLNVNGDGIYKKTRTWKSFGTNGGFFKTY